MKKIFSIITVLTVAVMIIPSSAQAITADELQTQINALLAQLSALQSQLSTLQGGTGTVTGCTITSFDRSLKQGMSGNDVKCLQVVLNSAADTQVAASGVGSSGSETTYFGALTKVAVIKFQEKYASEVLASFGLTSGTGYVGTTTRAKLNAMLAGGVVPTTPTTPTTPTLPTAAGLTVALASDTPAAATVVADGTSGDGGQSMADFLKIRFATAAGTSAKVTTLKITRSGISADSDLPNMYLFDGSTKLADTPSASNTVFTFTNSDGLFTVSGEKVITVKADIVNQVTSAKTIVLAVNLAADVVTNASAVNGTFPIKGNTMTTASVTDLGKITLATVSDPGSAITAGLTNQELWRFSLAAADQKIKISKIKFTVVGTIEADDLGNLSLTVDGSQLGSTAAKLDDDKTVTFDFTDSPYEIKAGVTKQLSVKGDLIGGSSRNFYFSVRNADDLLALDTNYGVYVKVNQSDTYTIIPASPTTTTISAGSLQITKKSDSPSGNIAKSATNVKLAAFNVKAVGEKIKITSLTVTAILAVHSDLTVDINNGKLIVDGTQVGTTTDLDTGAAGTGYTAFTLGSNFIVDAGQTKVLEIYADVLTGAGGAFDSSTTIETDLKVGSANYLRMSSGTSDNTPATTANNLTVTAAALSATKNSSVANMTVINSSTNVLLGSFLITAGAAEGVDVNTIVVDDANTTYALGDAFQNLTLWSGGVQYGSVITTPSTTAGGDNTFSLSTALRVPAGQSVRIDLRGDVKGDASSNWGAGGADVDYARITTSSSGIGLVTSSTVSVAANATAQKITASSAGTLTVASAATPTMPNNQLAVMGSTDIALAAWDFSASNTEDLKVTRIEVREILNEAPGNVQNLKLFVAGAQIPTGSPITIDSLNAATTSTYLYPYAIFEKSDGLFTIPKGGDVTVTLKGSITSFADASVVVDGRDLTFEIVQPATVCTATSTISAKGVSSGTYATSSSVTADSHITKTVRTKPTFALVGATSGTLISGTVEVMRFTITADSAYKVDYDGTLHNILFTIVSNKSSLVTGRAFQLYDASTDTALDTGVNATPNSAQTVDFDLDVGDFTIPAGQSKTLYVTANLQDFTTAGDAFQLYIGNAAADMSYGDYQIASDDISQANYQGLALPLYGPTWVHE